MWGEKAEGCPVSEKKRNPSERGVARRPQKTGGSETARNEMFWRDEGEDTSRRRRFLEEKKRKLRPKSERRAWRNSKGRVRCLFSGQKKSPEGGIREDI